MVVFLRGSTRRASHHTVGLAALVVASLFMTASPALAEPPQAETRSVAGAFARTAASYDVPRDLLVVLGHSQTHLDGHDGEPSASAGYGVMHLVSRPSAHTLEEAAELTGESTEELKRDTAANIRGAAAVLRRYADEAKMSAAARRDIGQWYQVVARYAHASSPQTARLFADTVYEMLGMGVEARTPAGERIVVPAQPVRAERGAYESVPDLRARPGDVGTQSTDYPPARWVPASSSNQTVSNRPTSYPIQYVVIHVTQGSYAGAISWFQNPSAQVSAHYVIRSSDGEVTQMVRHKDIGWHAGNWDYNTKSIGIEHEGWVDDASWFTDSMYRASAALTKFLCDTYGIPKTRTRIIGHNEVPGATHTDPGRYWDWNKYMALVTGGGDPDPPGWTTTIDNATTQFTASANWGASSWSSLKHGADYRYASPVQSSDPAWYSASIPEAGNYQVDVWYPSDPGYNNAAPYIVVTSSGNRSVYVDQRSGGGGWRSIGTFALNAGTYNVVATSRWTSGTGLVIADAVRISRV